MPTPVSRLSNVGIVQYMPETFLHRPHHAAVVMTVIATSSYIDTSTSSLMGWLTKSPGEASQAIFATIDSDRGRLRAITAAAAAILDEDNFMLFQAVMHVVQSVQKTRNVFAHNHWGLSNDLPDFVFLSDARAELAANNKWIETDRFDLEPSEDEFDEHWNLHLEAQAYNIDDLRRERERAEEARVFLSAFHMHLRFPEDDRQRQLLLQDHQLQQKYSRLRNGNVRP